MSTSRITSPQSPACSHARKSRARARRVWSDSLATARGATLSHPTPVWAGKVRAAERIAAADRGASSGSTSPVKGHW